MDFSLSTDHEILRESVRSFAEKEIKPVAAELDEKEEFSYETMQKMAELGLFGVFVSDKYGGQEMDYLSYIIAVEELARVDGSHAATVAAGNSLGIGPLYYFGNEEQKKKYLPKLCSGEALWGFGLTEPNAGSDSGNTQTNAVLDGNEWVINGSKIFITNAATDITAGSTVLVRTGVRDDGKPELSCIIVESGTPGFTAREMHGKLMWRASNTSELYFEDCRVPKENLLGPRGQGFHQMMKTLDGGRLSIGAMGLGGAQGCLDPGQCLQAGRYGHGNRMCSPAVVQSLLVERQCAAVCQRSRHGKTVLLRSDVQSRQPRCPAARWIRIDERI